IPPPAERHPAGFAAVSRGSRTCFFAVRSRRWKVGRGGKLTCRLLRRYVHLESGARCPAHNQVKRRIQGILNDEVDLTHPRRRAGIVYGEVHWDKPDKGGSLRSEEHTSELQSPCN